MPQFWREANLDHQPSLVAHMMDKSGKWSWRDVERVRNTYLELQRLKPSMVRIHLNLLRRQPLQAS